MGGNVVSDVRVGLVPVEKILFHPHNVRRDLGDLRSLVASIRRFGVMQPVVVERYGDMLRLRAGHRRVAAARLAGLRSVPAVVHGLALDDYEWIVSSVHENAQRRDLDHVERLRAVEAMRDQGASWEAVAEAFGVAASTARSWVSCINGDPVADEESPEPTAGSWRPRRRTPRGPVNGPVTTVGARRILDLVAHYRDRPDATVPEVLDAIERLTERRAPVETGPA